MSDRAAPASAAPPSGFIDRTFRLAERSTSAGREIIAGATTFAAMAYILAVNPSKISTTGMDRGDLVIATALAAVRVGADGALGEPAARGRARDGLQRHLRARNFGDRLGLGAVFLAFFYVTTMLM